jgi:hypothetical protein
MTAVRFELGRVVTTPGALGLGVDLLVYLGRHSRGDWGDLDEEDQAANERALMKGSRLFSAYNVAGEKRLWIITEADRSVTTFLLPGEY